MVKNKQIIVGAVVLVLLCIVLGITTASLFMGDKTGSYPPPAPARPVAAAPPTRAEQPAAPPPAAAVPAGSTDTAPPIDPEPNAPPQRGLTPEAVAENREEIARMKETLPGNMWIPEDPRFGYDPERGEAIGKAIVLENKIRNGTATREEEAAYYRFKIRSLADRIDLIRYIADRTGQLAEETGKAYLTGDDVTAGADAIAGMEAEIESYREKLDALGE